MHEAAETKIRSAAFRPYLKRGIAGVRQIPEQKKLEAEVMHAAGMRRIQIYIDEELDERLQVEAARTGRSKASLIRESVAARMGKSTSLADDPLNALVGSLDCDPAAVDEVVHGS